MMAMAASTVLTIILFSLLHLLSLCSSDTVSLEELVEQERKRGGHVFHSFNRKINKIHRHMKEAQTTLHDVMYPPTTFPQTPVTNPVTTPALTIPPANPTPTIVTVTPTNPSTTPISVPSTTPITVPPINPVNDPPPITVPGTNTPVTNPVTTYPFSPPVTNPVTTPTTNPMMPPATTNAPTGQSWCVAKSGAQEAQLQTALDYACGSGLADCSAIQQTGSCYNPNSLQYHASYAFNSYYQKNPVSSSCDFGGTAMLVNINPSVGSCVYPSSASAAATTAATTGAGAGGGSGQGAGTVIGSAPPSVLNTGNPAADTGSIFGTEPPPSGGTTISNSVRIDPLCQCIVLTVCILAARLILSR